VEGMSALANSGWESRDESTVGAMPFPESTEETALRERMLIMRDIILVLALQLVFRATMALRRWNY
jgi:hypothetical protein